MFNLQSTTQKQGPNTTLRQYSHLIYIIRLSLHVVTLLISLTTGRAWEHLYSCLATAMYSHPTLSNGNSLTLPLQQQFVSSLTLPLAIAMYSHLATVMYSHLAMAMYSHLATAMYSHPTLSNSNVFSPYP